MRIHHLFEFFEQAIMQEKKYLYDQYIEALGATPVDYLTKADCCGVSLALAGDKEASNCCVKTKLIDVKLSGAQLISTACPSCFNQFDSF